MRITALILGLSIAATVTAQPAETQRGPLVKLTACRALSDDAARLKCFDAAVAVIADAAQKNDLVVMDREDIRQTRRGLFGFSFPKLPFFGGGKDGAERAKIEPIEEVASVITSARNYRYALWRLTLQDDSEWETIEPFVTTIPKEGDAVTIKRNGIGTYFLKVSGGKGAKAIRRR